MTVVAAYKKHDIPVLIGDMALMKGEIRSLRKKAYIITHNLAIAWTGYSIVAKVVIKDLMSAFPEKAATKADLEALLTAYGDDDFGSLHTNFIGWIIDGTEDCFRWNCLYPSQVFYDSKFSDGTGEEYFENLGNEASHIGGSPLPRRDQAILSVINEVARARFDESLYSDSWDVSFGASYDILMFLDGRFKYVRSISYIGWDYHWDSERGTGRLEQAPVIIRHLSTREYSIIQESLQGPHHDDTTFNYLSRPVYDDMPNADLSNLPFTLQSDYYANYFLFREGGKTPFKLLMTIQKLTPEGPLKIRSRRGAYFLDFDTDILDNAYARHASSG